MSILVTGAYGFIGANLIKALNQQGITNIIAVDDLTNGRQFINNVDHAIADYWDKDELSARLATLDMPPITHIFHQGACSTTTEWDGRYMMENNFTFSKNLCLHAIERNIPFIYASSAAVYGANTQFAESRENERPLNVYGYSKWRFDEWVRQLSHTSPKPLPQIAGLRYFNVYGPHEQHKDNMVSVAYRLRQQLLDTGTVKLFGAYDGCEPGMHQRDFVFVEDVVNVNLWLMDNPQVSGIFNCGSGRAQTFNDVANAVIAYYGQGKIEYIDFPDSLKGAYQSFTQADLSQLRAAGYDKAFKNVEEGVKAYMAFLDKAEPRVQKRSAEAATV